MLGRTSVQVDLVLPATAAEPELARGASVTLVVRQGLVEIRVGASAGATRSRGASPMEAYARAHTIAPDDVHYAEALADHPATLLLASQFGGLVDIARTLHRAATTQGPSGAFFTFA